MKYRASFNKYLSQIDPMDSRPFYCGVHNRIKQVVVIPCFAESRYILKTLYSLSQNNSDDLNDSLILCVVNNRGRTITDSEILADNQLTMSHFDMLIKGKMDNRMPAEMEQVNLLKKILKTNLRIAYVDASSAGFELPNKVGGVGMARKIGLDKAISLFDSNDDIGLLYCLDADTVVENNYLAAVKLFFTQEQSTAAHVSFAHQEAEEESLQAAIICYEIFLRYYVFGLQYAGSPYAFHTIGSTIICTIDGYAAVRGMNNRQAGEDFYFLNKLAKLDGVRSIRSTTVYPSARSSTRVPFGTGKAIMKYGKVN